MATRFYLNDIEIKVQTNASFTQITGSQDVGVCELELTDSPNLIAPMTPFRVENNGDVWNFVVIQDIVDVATKVSPRLYKHTLTFAENSHELSTHILRNSVFTQPIAKTQKLNHGVPFTLSVLYKHDNTIVFNNNANLPTTLIHNENTNRSELTRIGTRNKLAGAYIDLTSRVQCFKNIRSIVGNIVTYQTPKSLHFNTFTNLVIRLVNANNENDYLQFTKSNGDASRINLNNVQLSWLENKSFYLTVVSATYSEPDDLELTTKNDDLYQKNVLGHIKLEMVISQYTWSLYDVLATIEKQSRKDFNNSTNSPLFTMPSIESEKGQILNSTVAPEFTFTGMDLFTAVAKIMQYIDAYPTLDQNGVLGFDYLNDQSKIQSTLKLTDKNAVLSEQYYTNKLIAQYQNAKQNNCVYYPSNNTFSRMNASGYGVPNKTEYEFKVDKPIDYIDKLLVNVDDYVNIEIYYPYRQEYEYELIDIGFFGVRWLGHTLDITEAVIEESEYATLLYENADASFPNQLNTITYKQYGNSIKFGAIADVVGNKTIENVFKYAFYWSAVKWFGFHFYQSLNDVGERVSGLMGINSTGFNTEKVQDLHLQLQYHAILNGQVSIESQTNKHEGETFISQSDSSTELNRLGRNMVGLIAKLGNDTDVFALKLDSYDNRLKVGSLWVDDDNNKYIANKVKTTFSTNSDKVVVEAQMTKNFNSISSFTSVDQERRFYEISEKITTSGYENITQFIYLSTTPIQSEYTALTNNAIQTILSLDKANVYTSDLATVQAYEFENDVNVVDYDAINETTDIYYISIPIHTYGLGNAICFEMNYNSPINAGDRLTGEGTTENPYLNKTTLYTVKNGYADKINLKVFDLHEIETTNLNYTEDYPAITVDQFNDKENDLIIINSLKYFKRPNEILHLNYEVALLSPESDEIYIGKEFINENGIIPTPEKKTRKVEVWVGYTDNEKYSILDTNALGTKIGTATITGTLEATVSVGSLQSPTIKSWCFADENGNLLIGVNEIKTLTPNATNTFKLYYAAKKQRI